MQVHSISSTDSESDEDDSAANPVLVSPGASSSSVGPTRQRRRPKALTEEKLPVMFTGDHVRELQPQNWKDTPLGTGS